MGRRVNGWCHWGENRWLFCTGIVSTGVSLWIIGALLVVVLVVVTGWWIGGRGVRRSTGVVSWGKVGGDFGTVVAYFSRRFSTNLFRGVTDAMGTEGAEECGALDIVLGWRDSGDVSMMEVEYSHIQNSKLLRQILCFLKQIHQILPGFCAMLRI